MPTTKTITVTVKRNFWQEKDHGAPSPLPHKHHLGEIDCEFIGDDMKGRAWTSTVMTYYGAMSHEDPSSGGDKCGDGDSCGDGPPPDCGVFFDGHSVFEGTVLGHTGSFVFVESGTCPGGGVLKSTMRILPGTGTGELIGIQGNGTQTIDFSQVGPKDGDLSTKEFTFELPW